MKHKVFFALCCLLFFAGFNAAAQDTAPLPPPDESASPLPPPGSGGEASGKSVGGGIFGALPMPQRRQPGQGSGSVPAAQPATTPNKSGSGSATPPDKGSSTPAAQPDKGASASAARTETAAPVGIPPKGFYWGAMAGFSKFDYQGDEPNTKDWEGRFDFSGGLILARDFGIWALQTELLVSIDNLKYKTSVLSIEYGHHEEKNYISGPHLQIPILAKLDLHLGRFLLQPLAGIYWIIGLDALKYKNTYWSEEYTVEHYNPLLGFMGGGTVGFRIGKGHIIMDTRYAVDLGATRLETNEQNNSWIYFNRSAVNVSFGYQRYF
jgi:hypothetical protein